MMSCVVHDGFERCEPGEDSLIQEEEEGGGGTCYTKAGVMPMSVLIQSALVAQE